LTLLQISDTSKIRRNREGFMSENITDGDRFVQAGDLEVTPVPDGAMIYQKQRERVHYLNPTALIVFELCGMGKTVDEMITFVADSFALDSRPVAEIRSCLDSLVGEELVRRA
jgi:hypothetical protein